MLDDRGIYILSQIACMQAELEAMKVRNAECALRGEYPVYGPDDFRRLPDQYGLGCNTVLGYLHGHN